MGLRMVIAEVTACCTPLASKTACCSGDFDGCGLLIDGCIGLPFEPAFAAKYTLAAANMHNAIVSMALIDARRLRVVTSLVAASENRTSVNAFVRELNPQRWLR